MEIRPFAPGLEAAWNAFNARARNGHFLFDRGFMTYHADRFLEASLVVLEDGEVRALFPANRAGETVHSHQGLTFGGLVVDDARTAEVMAMLDACAAHWRAEGATRLAYKPLPWIYHRRPAQDDLYWLFRKGAQLTRRDVTASIRTAAPGPRSQRRTRGEKKARAAGLSVARSDRWADFWDVLGEVLGGRHGVAPVHSLDEMRLLAGRFPDNIGLHLALDADGAILAGVALFATPEVAHAQYIAASEAGRAVGALDLVMSELIAREGASRAWFDFGISNEDGGRVLNEGLMRQKEEFGASAVVHDQYLVELSA